MSEPCPQSLPHPQLQSQHQPQPQAKTQVQPQLNFVERRKRSSLAFAITTITIIGFILAFSIDTIKYGFMPSIALSNDHASLSMSIYDDGYPCTFVGGGRGRGVGREQYFTLAMYALGLTTRNNRINAATSSSYGVDVSFPIHSLFLFLNDDRRITTDHCKKVQRQIYKEFMDGCVEKYGEENGICELSEMNRMEACREQPKSMINYTVVGFQKTHVSRKVYDQVMEIQSFTYSNNEYSHKGDLRRGGGHEEKWVDGSTFTNHWLSPTSRMELFDSKGSFGAGTAKGVSSGPSSCAFSQRTKNLLENDLRRLAERWVGIPMTVTASYGPRSYRSGAIVASHVDRPPFVITAVAYIDSTCSRHWKQEEQGVASSWPLELYGRDGKAYNFTFQHPGEVLLYEGNSIVHGRPFPFKGEGECQHMEYYVHFEPVGHAQRQRHHQVQYSKSMKEDGVGVFDGGSGISFDGEEEDARMLYNKASKRVTRKLIHKHSSSSFNEYDVEDDLLDILKYTQEKVLARDVENEGTSKSPADRKSFRSMKMMENFVAAVQDLKLQPTKATKQRGKRLSQEHRDYNRQRNRVDIVLASKEEEEDVVQRKLLDDDDATKKLFKYRAAHEAAKEGNITFLDEIADANLSILNRKDTHGWTPLHEAVHYGQLDVSEFLLMKYRIYCNTMTKSGQTVLYIALKEHGKESKMFHSLKQKGCLILPLMDEKITSPFQKQPVWPTHVAAECGDLIIWEEMLNENPIAIDIKDSNGWRPLHVAARSGYVDIVKLLVDVGNADVNATTNDGRTSLLIAMREHGKDHSVVKFLKERNALDYANVDVSIRFAAQDGNLDALIKIVERDPKALTRRDENGWEPIHEATRSGHINVVRYLLAHGADVNVQTNRGDTPLCLAFNRYGKEHELVLFFQRHGGLRKNCIDGD